ncbi:MAG: T9SS type A sorting domain-containing protein [Bacteroidota bacterium]
MKNFTLKTKVVNHFSLLKTVVLIFFMSFVGSQESKAQYTSIPDPNFEQALIDFGYDNIIDGQVLTANVSAVNYLALQNRNITNLTGIEAFTALRILYCQYNQLTSLNVSGLTNLIELNCSFNQLTSLNVTGLTNLLLFYCSSNQLTSLNLNGITNLVYLRCGQNLLTSLNVSGLTNLTELHCNNNQLTSLTVTVLTNLNSLICSTNQLTSLNVKGLTALSGNTFYSDGNQLSCILADTVADKTNWYKDSWAAYSNTSCATTAIPDPAFEQALIYNGYDNIIDGKVNTTVVNEITSLYVAQSNITNLTGIAAFTALTELYCNNNQLVSLNVSGLTNLTYIECNNNQLTSLTITGLTNLSYLNCSTNQLTSLTVTGLTNLTYLDCSSNSLTGLTVTGLTNLNTLYCFNNQLTNLNVKALTGLSGGIVGCTANQLTCILADTAADKTNWFKDSWAAYTATTCATTAIPDANFEQALIDNGYDNIIDAKVNTDVIKVIPSLDMSSRDIANLTGIAAFNALTDLYCDYNSLTSLNVSALTNLRNLTCGSNQLTSLNVSGLTNLDYLDFTYNQLTSINLTGLTNLTTLYFFNNSLTQLDFTTNTQLVSIDARNNSISGIDLRNNTTNTINLYASGNAPLSSICKDSGDTVNGYWDNGVVPSFSAKPTGSATQTFCNGAKVSNLAATGTAIKWYSFPTGHTALATTTNLVNNITYYASQTVGNCEGTLRLAVTVTINVTPAPTSAAQTFCNSGTVANLVATGTAIKWYSAATGGTVLAGTTALATGTYYASQTLNACESATRTAVSVTVNVTAVPTASAQAFCNSATVANLVATGTAIKWYAAATGGTALASTTALATGTYYASQTLNACESATRKSVSVTINVSPAAPTASAQAFCNSGTVANLVATGTAIKWYSASTGGTALATTTALATGTYYASQTLNTCESATRKAVSVTLNTTVAPTATAQTFCNSGTVANLVATGTAIKWYSAATGGTALATTTALATGTYYASQTLNTCESATRTAVSVTVNVTPVPTATAQTFCNTGTVSNLVATGTAIKWYSAATGGTALASTTVLATGTYYASQTLNGCESATRTAVSVTVNVTAVPTASSQTFCNTGTVANLIATGTAIKWYSAATGGTALGSTTLLATGTYYATQSLNACESATRKAVSVTVNTTAAPTAVAQTFCSTATVANLTATGTVIKWYSAATGGAALATTTVLTTGTYYASQTLNACESGTRTSVSVTVNVTPAPTASTQTFCKTGTVANLTATGTAIKWYSVATGGTALTSTTALSTSTYYASQTINACESVTRTAVQVTINITDTSAPTASAQTFCNTATVANLVATGTAIKWYLADTGGTALATTTTLSTRTYYASQTVNTCESVARTAVSVILNVTAAPTATATQTFCMSGTVANLTATGTAVKWYLAAIGGTALTSTSVLSTRTYYASQTLNSCESATRRTVSVIVNTSPTEPPTAASQTFCMSGKISDLAAAGTAIKWYLASTGGSALSVATSLSTRTYYASQTVSACESTTRTAVSVIVNTTPTAAPTANSQTFCSAVTVANLVATGTDIQWYTAIAGDTAPLESNTALGTGTYYASQTINGCESVERTAVSITVSITPSPTADSQAFCKSGVVANLTASGTAIKWYLAATGGTALASTTALATATYYASQTVSGCESPRTAVSVIVNTTATPAPTASAQTFCNSATVANLVATGTAIKWYSTSTGTTTALSNTTVLGTRIYYASQTINGCVSTTRTAVSVTVNLTAAPTASSTQTFQNTATVANLIATGTAIKWYPVATGGIALATTATLVTGNYYASQTLNGCESASRKAVSVAINAGVIEYQDQTQSKEIITNEETALLKAYPNPFASTFKVDFTTKSNANIELVVYNITGTVVEWHTVKAVNINNVELGSNYTIGLYIIILKQGNFTKTFRVSKNSN